MPLPQHSSTADGSLQATTGAAVSVTPEALLLAALGMLANREHGWRRRVSPETGLFTSARTPKKDEGTVETDRRQILELGNMRRFHETEPRELGR